MSQGKACQCDEQKKPLAQRRWVVLQRNCNYSAFSGYHYTPSDYSCVQCHACGSAWRTKADYVLSLKDGSNVYDLPADQWPTGHTPIPAPAPAAERKCATCAHLRPRTPQDHHLNLKYEKSTLWCAKNDLPTELDLCRCGGDDYAPKPAAH